MKKTNAMRLLDSQKIAYDVLTYQVDENNLDALYVADKIGLPVAQVFKTLVLQGDKTGIIVACLPGDKQVDLKEMAKVSGNKNAQMVPLTQVLALTGYIRGGVSPLAMKKVYPFYLDEKANLFDRICVSAGIRGLQMFLPPSDLLKATCGKLTKISL